MLRYIHTYRHSDPDLRHVRTVDVMGAIVVGWRRDGNFAVAVVEELPIRLAQHVE